MRTTASEYRFHHSHRLAAIGLVLSCLLCVSCANVFTKSPVSEKGNGAVAISLRGQSAKTIVAGSTDYFGAINAYKVTVSGNGNTYTSTTVNSSDVCTITGIVAGSGYAVTVQAYSDSGATTQIAQGGASSVAISEGATTSLSITLSFTQAASTGGFSLQIQWPVSTGLAYVYATLDGTAIPVPTVTTGSTYYSSTLSASSLAGGVHTLDIYFRTSSSATTVIGPFIESVNIWDGVIDTMWADSNGKLNAMLTLGSSEFASTDASLAGISVSGTVLSGFSPTTLTYNYGTTPTGAFTVAVTADSSGQSLSYSFNDTAGVWASVSGNTFTTAVLTAVSGGPNTVKITVTAADRQTSATYVVTGSQLLTQSAFLSSLSGVTSGLALTANYVLNSDITLSAANFTSIAEYTYNAPTNPFNGTFDGNGHTITLSLTTVGGIQGLFRNIGSSGVVKNLNIVVTISPGQNDWIGAVAAINYGTISNCSVSGSVTGRLIVGGLVGCNNSTGVISGCYSTATCIYNGGQYYGSLVGKNFGMIKNCYARGPVPASSGSIVGGLVGYNDLGATIQNCYSTGAVSGGSPVGGLVGTNAGTLTACFYDTTTSGMSDGNGTPTSTANMKTQTTFSGWDFSTVWGIDTNGTINKGYPYLQYFGSNTVTP